MAIQHRFLSLLANILVFATLVTASGQTFAAEEPLILPLTKNDQRFMENQRESIDTLAKRYLGDQLNGQKDHDLAILQRLLDRNIVKSDQKKELQAMGVIMGDFLAYELDLDWVLYEDEVGRSRALRYKETDNYLFPMTMISRRREAGSTTPVTDIYQKAYDIMQSTMPKNPYSLF